MEVFVTVYVRLNARSQIVEATNVPQESEYTEVAGSVEGNMPLGLFGFNGRVYTPNYMLQDGVVVARTAEDMARDPYSDEPEPDEAISYAALAAAYKEGVDEA